MTDLCQILEWDSQFFGRRVARVNQTSLDENSLQQILTWCAAERINFLYLLVDAAAQETVRIAEAHRFQLVDIRLTLDAKATQTSTIDEQVIRPHLPDDVAALKAIARVSHRDSRFYADDHLPPELSDLLYETWLGNSCNGYADQVLVAVHENDPVGYITCHLHGTEGQIGLLGVSDSAQGIGLGSKLINAALDWFAQHNAGEVTVVTQGRNVRAQRAYQRNGFRTQSVQLWYHRWFV